MTTKIAILTWPIVRSWPKTWIFRSENLSLSNMYEFYEKIRAGARVFELFENMPVRAPAISDPQKTCHAGPRAGARAQSTFDPLKNPPAPARGPTPLKTS